MRTLVYLLTATAFVWLVSCSTVTTLTEYPDGRKVTVTTKTIDPTVIPLSEAAASVATQIIAEK